MKLNNKFSRRFSLISCHQVPRVHLKNLLKFQVTQVSEMNICQTGTVTISVIKFVCRGVGTGPAGPATAGPMFPEPTIKNIIPLFITSKLKKLCYSCIFVPF